MDADQRLLEERSGVTFEVAEGGEAESIRTTVSDQSAGTEIAVRLWALPSRLGELVAAAGRVDAASLTVDAYEASVRVALSNDAAGRAVQLEQLRADVEALDGSVRAERLPSEMNGADLTTAVSSGEAELAAGVKRVFDPDGVLWGRSA